METVSGSARAQLRAFVERIENLEEDKKGIAADIKDVYGEAKAQGFDTKVLRAVIARRKKKPGEAAEFDSLLATYLHALAMEGGGLVDPVRAEVQAEKEES